MVSYFRCFYRFCLLTFLPLGAVVQSWVSTNSGLKFNPMFQFLYFCTSVYFKTLQTKTAIDQDKISKEISRNTINKLLESLEINFTLTQG